jgi:dUTP pyrophosphatase
MTKDLAMRFEKLFPDAKLPHRGHEMDAGIDVHAYMRTESGRPITRMIPPREVVTLQTGLKIAPPDGCAVLVLSRSGLAASGVFVANAPGLIDSGYRGELRVILYNGSPEPYYVKHEDRIAQLVLFPLTAYHCVEDAISEAETDRGAQGFGSTGR